MIEEEENWGRDDDFRRFYEKIEYDEGQNKTLKWKANPTQQKSGGQWFSGNNDEDDDNQPDDEDDDDFEELDTTTAPIIQCRGNYLSQVLLCFGCQMGLCIALFGEMFAI